MWQKRSRQKESINVRIHTSTHQVAQTQSHLITTVLTGILLTTVRTIYISGQTIGPVNLILTRCMIKELICCIQSNVQNFLLFHVEWDTGKVDFMNSAGKLADSKFSNAAITFNTTTKNSYWRGSPCWSVPVYTEKHPLRCYCFMAAEEALYRPALVTCCTS